MKYLMMCINESLRIYPPAVRYCLRAANVYLFFVTVSQAIAINRVEVTVSKESNYTVQQKICPWVKTIIF